MRSKTKRSDAGSPPNRARCGRKPLAVPSHPNPISREWIERDIGFQRSGVWGEETAAQKIEHMGLMFGALAASPNDALAGRGIPSQHLTFAILIFPEVWDWYVQWRERRRGFYTRWEVEMFRLAMALTRKGTGWLRQQPHLANRLAPLEGLITGEDVLECKLTGTRPATGFMGTLRPAPGKSSG